jgi:DNA-directed RNA polymerase alpha subunit
LISAEQRERDRLEVLKASALADTDLCTRTLNSLEDKGIILIGDLAPLTREELELIPNFGDKTIEECCTVFDRLKVPHPDWRKKKQKRARKHK